MPLIKIELKNKNEVLCDLCCEDYSFSNAQGGIIYDGKAICPTCFSKFKEIKKKRIDCPVYLSFRDFIYSYREHQNKKGNFK